MIKRKKTKKKPKPKVKKRKTKKTVKSNFASMQKKIEICMNKLKKDLKRKAPVGQIQKNYNELLMLLGECNYIVREFHDRKIK